MYQFFIFIYSWFCDSSLTVFKIMDAIWDSDGDMLMSSSFTTMGMTTAVISILIAVAFYIWPINHPRFKAWWAWLIMLLINILINFGLGFVFLHHRLLDIQYSEEDILDSLDLEEPLTLSLGEWLDLAFSNAGVSILFFVFASLCLTWFSTNCRFSPFRN